MILRKVSSIFYVILFLLTVFPGILNAKESQSVTVLFTGDLNGWVTPIPS